MTCPARTRWLLAAVVALAVAGCGGSAARRTASRAAVPTVTVTYDGTTCAPSWVSLKPGSYDFAIANQAQDSIGLQLLDASTGQAASRPTPVQTGDTATVRATLRPGTSYQWQCETPEQAPALSAAVAIPGRGGALPRTAGGGISTADLNQPLDHYIAHESGLLATLRGQLRTLDARLAAGALPAAERAWLSARLTWLALGQDDGAYGAFGALGGEIDGLDDGDPGGTASPSFTGFHRVEYDLYEAHDLTAARHDAARLTGAVDAITSSALAADLPLTTLGVDAWVLRTHEILEDALRDTLSGEDDYGSHDGLPSVQADVDATREMLSVLGGVLDAHAPGLVRTGERNLDAISAAVRATGPRHTAIGALGLRERQRLNASVDAALETLAPASELLQLSGADS